LERAAGLFGLSAETAGVEDADLERFEAPYLDEEALLGAQSRHGVDEALSERRLLGAAADEYGERPGQRVEQRPFVSASPVDPEERLGRAAARPGSDRIWEHLLRWRHVMLAAPEGTQLMDPCSRFVPAIM
jgi:hypothetical protein